MRIQYKLNGFETEFVQHIEDATEAYRYVEWIRTISEPNSVWVWNDSGTMWINFQHVTLVH